MTKADFGIFLENYDKRGSIFRGDYKKKEIFLITEIKKGETRGGHYHTTIVNHHVLRGKIMYKEIRLTKKGLGVEANDPMSGFFAFKKANKS